MRNAELRLAELVITEGGHWSLLYCVHYFAYLENLYNVNNFLNDLDEFLWSRSAVRDQLETLTKI